MDSLRSVEPVPAGHLAEFLADDRSVEEVKLPAPFRALSTLESVDYEDAFLVNTRLAPDRLAEQRARTILEQVPLSFRLTARMVWLALGLNMPTRVGLLGTGVAREAQHA